jgi:tetratricopeptide (TPR) repeat protein
MTAIGALLNERYRIDTRIGRGGMGIVYRAHDMLLDRDVALKVLSETALDSASRSRLLREAQAAARLSHPNIASIHDAGEADGLPFIVMELVKGPSLHDQRPEALDDVLAIARQVCAALEHAHTHGIVHRDLKPENVLLAPDPLTGTGSTAKLVDFGLARSVTSRLTAQGTIMGTVFYLAPELALGQEFDGRADLYALGVMLYELTTGRLPFTADDPVAVISQHLYAPIVPPRARNPEIPPPLDGLILCLLSKDPKGRPSSAAKVLQILDSPAILEREAVPAEELSVLERIERGRMVGRERELKEARTLWHGVVSGQGRVLLISGEPGIGKTRLVRELVTQIRVSGGRALVGQCYAEGGAPYGPFAQVVRQSLRGGAGDGLDLPEFVLSDLLILAPTLRIKYPGIPPNPRLDPLAEQHRLYESVAAFFAALSESAPVMLVLEDVHWADSGTLALLCHVARRIHRWSLLIVATYREMELDEMRPFHEVLLDLGRERLASRLKLTRLDREQTRDLLAILFIQEITPEFLEGIYRETEGNPFFIEEVCKALLESGKLVYEDGRWHRSSMDELGIPQSVRVAIQSRVRVLPADAQEALHLAAVLGREFDFETLAEASALAGGSELDEETLIDALEAAQRAQLIEEVSSEHGGTFLFAHGLIPTTLTESLSGLRRRHMHRQVMAAIERLHPDDLESLAHHALESRDLQKVLHFSLCAVEKARRLFAHDEALHHATHALEAAEALELTEKAAEISERIGDICDNRGTVPAAVEAYLRALELTSQPTTRATLKCRIGALYVAVGDDRGLAFLQDAAQELDPDTQTKDLALALAAIGRYYHHHGLHQQERTYLERAYEIAAVLGDPETLKATYASLAGLYLNLAEFEKSMEWAHRLIALGEQGNNAPDVVALGYETLAEASFLRGRWEDALEFARQDRRFGERSGHQSRVAWAGWSTAHAMYGTGDLVKGSDVAQTTLELANMLGDSRLEVVIGSVLSMIQMDMGQEEAALETATLVKRRGNELGQIIMVAAGNSALAYWHTAREEWEEANELLESSARGMAQSDNLLVPLWYGLPHSIVSLHRGDLEKAEQISTRILTIAQESRSRHTEGVTRRVQAQILAAQGVWNEAERAFDEATAILEGIGSRLELGRALYHQSEMQVKRGQTDGACASLTRSLEIFRDCGAKIDAERTRAALNSLETGP